MKAADECLSGGDLLCLPGDNIYAATVTEPTCVLYGNYSGKLYGNDYGKHHDGESSGGEAGERRPPACGTAGERGDEENRRAGEGRPAVARRREPRHSGEQQLHMTRLLTGA